MTRNRVASTAVILSLLICGYIGCNDNHKRMTYDPAEQFPEWAYDAPFYYRPASEKGDIGHEQPPAGPGCPTHYYTKDRILYLPRPAVGPVTSRPDRTVEKRFSSSELAPRIGVYVTDCGGEVWKRAGYFGQCQTHFVYNTENDGSYGFRFAGPGIPPARTVPPVPMVVYHVDTTVPSVVVYIEPDQERYHISEQVTLRWTVSDMNLMEKSVSIAVSWEPNDLCEPQWSVINKELEAEGAMAFVIPPHIQGKALKIRAEARDRAGNLGVSFSEPLIVVDETAAPTTQASSSLDSLLTDPAEQAIHLDAAKPSSDATDAAPSLKEGAGVSALPPMSAAPRRSERHWSARPWQVLSPEAFLESTSIWLLPSASSLGQ